MHAHGPAEHLDDSRRANTSGHVDGQTLTRELIDHRQTLQLLTIGAGVEHKVVCPKVSRARCRQRARPARRNPSPWPFSRHL